MHINPYGQDPVLLAADLVNVPPSSTGELVERCLAAGVSRDWEPVGSDLPAVRDFLRRWEEVVDAGPGAERARLLNALLAESTGPPRLTDHDGHWHLHHRDDGLGLAGVLRALLATGTATHLATRGWTGSAGAPRRAAPASTPTSPATAGSATAAHAAATPMRSVGTAVVRRSGEGGSYPSAGPWASPCGLGHR